jgi:hypothetical protein
MGERKAALVTQRLLARWQPATVVVPGTRGQGRPFFLAPLGSRQAWLHRREVGSGRRPQNPLQSSQSKWHWAGVLPLSYFFADPKEREHAPNGIRHHCCPAGRVLCPWRAVGRRRPRSMAPRRADLCWWKRASAARRSSWPRARRPKPCVRPRNWPATSRRSAARGLRSSGVSRTRCRPERSGSVSSRN